MPNRLPDASDLNDPAAFSEGPPHGRFDELRTQPLSDAGRSSDGTQLWSSFRFADIAAISRDTSTFSSAAGGVFPNRDQVFPLELARNMMLFKDPPEHTKYRKILQTAFTPSSVNKLEGDVRRIVVGQIDSFIDAGRCDFVRDFAVPVPLAVLARLLGASDAEIPKLQGWTDRIERAQGSPEPGAGLPVFAELAVFLSELITRQEGRDDQSLVATLAAADVDGKSLTHEEIVTFFGALVFAGNDTTRNTMSAGLLALIEHPDQVTLLRGQPQHIPNAVEEILRWTSVVNYFCRTATMEAEVSGCPIHKGDKVTLWYSAGSRDPNINPDPHDFNVARVEPKHMAFGGGGRHFCLGAGLARLELRIVFEELLIRLEHIKLDGEPRRSDSNWVNSLTSLPISFRAADAH